MSYTPDALALKKQLQGIGISEGYAYDLVQDPPRRSPSRDKAFLIWRELGVKMGPLKNLPDDVILAIESAGQ